MKYHFLIVCLLLSEVLQVLAWQTSVGRGHVSSNPLRMTTCRGATAESSIDGLTSCRTRRQVVTHSVQAAVSLTSVSCAALEPSKQLKLVTDPSTYSALVYTPPPTASTSNKPPPPLLIVLHGAGKNQETAWSLADPRGEHAGLAPSLLSTNQAPDLLKDNFAVVSPYSAGKLSFYDEPRSKILQFVEWVCSDAGRQAGCPVVDPANVFLFGFSDGATLAVELATTRRFKACVIAAYGFTGILPPFARQRLKGIPFWVFHSADDVIFDVGCSDRLVASLRDVNQQDAEIIRYTRYDKDQEGFTGSVQGHSTGITASRLPDIYEWMLSISKD